MTRSLTLVPIGIFLVLTAGCASEEPFDGELDGEQEVAAEEDQTAEEDQEEGIIGEAEEVTGDGSLPDGLLPPYCNNVTSWDANWASFEAEVITLINQKRAAGATCGATYYGPAPALTKHDNLRCSARVHSKDMGTNNFFSHTGSNGSTFSQRMTSAGYAWTAAAENIGAGYTTPTAAVNGWMASEGHCKNIMSKTYVHVGVGYQYSSTATYKHYWTQNFGKQ
jgi:uncharacterized protein YkwD